MVVVGDREAETETVSVRQRGGKNLGTKTLAEVIALIRNETPEVVRKGTALYE